MKHFIALLLLGSIAPPGSAFLGPSNVAPTQLKSTTQVHLFDFLNEGKKALVKKLAGEYDAENIRGRVDTLVTENPVFMFSFTT